MTTLSAPPPVAAPQMPTPRAPVSRPKRTGVGSSLWRCLVFVAKYLLGVLLCLSFVGSVIVVGWVLRLMQRSTLKAWHRAAGGPIRGETFADFAAADAQTALHLRFPNWLLRQRGLAAPGMAGGGSGLEHASGHPIRRAITWPVASLGRNIKLGAQGIFNVWAVTMPGCALWLFAWYDGWNNSFNKGHEQAWVGPTTGLLGVLLFIVAMMYLPLAQARQAATGDWRSFYDFRLVRRVIRRRFPACLLLAGLYVLLALPMYMLKTAPLQFDRMPGYEQLSDAQVLEVLNGYFFWCCWFVFPAYVLVRIVAARIYAGGVLAALKAGDIEAKALGSAEAAALGRLGLLEPVERAARHVLLRVSVGVGARVARCAAGAAAFVIWFAFVALIFISEFFNYHPAIGWLNQPLVQLPWFRYLP